MTHATYSISILLLGAFLMQCCLVLITEVNAGKGKGGRQGHIIIQNEIKDRNNQVPIYMPIPIPIPMPMGPIPPNGKYHSNQQQQQQQHNDGEGEVKKIYLLQPVPKTQPQPHLKGGGFMGPVQNNIHLTPAGGHSSVKTRLPARHVVQQQQQSHEGDSGRLENHQSGDDNFEQQPIKSHGHKSELKILPIVVIPPIAPMPPIQLPPNQDAHRASRVTFKPQFNNYLVSSSESDDRRGAYSQVNKLQDYRTFSDYGGSLGGSVYRENFGGMKARIRSRQVRPQDSYNQAIWSRSKVFDERGDDQDAFSSRRSFHHQSARGGRLAPSMARRRAMHAHRPPRLGNSIRDILDQQVTFDDEPTDVSAHHEARGSEAPRSADCCGYGEHRRPNYRHGFSSHHHNNNNNNNNNLFDQDNANSEQLETAAEVGGELVERDQAENQDNQQARQPDEPAADSSHRGRGSDLNTMYYDRDVSASIMQPRPMVADRQRQPLHLDEREILNDEDEWRFESIKSVSHASPSNSTVPLTTTTNMNSTAAYSITTTEPPSLGNATTATTTV